MWDDPGPNRCAGEQPNPEWNQVYYFDRGYPVDVSPYDSIVAPPVGVLTADDGGARAANRSPDSLIDAESRE